jgi:hypothetical protein
LKLSHHERHTHNYLDAHRTFFHASGIFLPFLRGFGEYFYSSGISQDWNYALESHEQIEVGGEIVKNWEIYKIDFYLRHYLSTSDTKVLGSDKLTQANTRAEAI